MEIIAIVIPKWDVEIPVEAVEVVEVEEQISYVFN